MGIVDKRTSFTHIYQTEAAACYWQSFFSFLLHTLGKAWSHLGPMTSYPNASSLTCWSLKKGRAVSDIGALQCWSRKVTTSPDLQYCSEMSNISPTKLLWPVNVIQMSSLCFSDIILTIKSYVVTQTIHSIIYCNLNKQNQHHLRAGYEQVRRVKTWRKWGHILDLMDWRD